MEKVDLEESLLNRLFISNRLYFLKEIVLAHFERFFGRSNRDLLLENKGKIHEGG